MQQRGGELALHPLAEREGAHLLLDKRAEVEQVRQLAERGPKLRVGEPVHDLVHEECITRRDVPLELALVAHHHTHPAQVRSVAPERLEAKHAHAAGGGMQQPGEHLESGRLARAVRPEEADNLARRHLEGYVVNRPHVTVLAAHKALQRGA